MPKYSVNLTVGYVVSPKCVGSNQTKLRTVVGPDAEIHGKFLCIYIRKVKAPMHIFTELGAIGFKSGLDMEVMCMLH